jgi:hypothetical protein
MELELSVTPGAVSKALQTHDATRRSPDQIRTTAQLDNLLQRRTFLPLNRRRSTEETNAATASISRTHSQCQRGAMPQSTALRR